MKPVFLMKLDGHVYRVHGGCGLAEAALLKEKAEHREEWPKKTANPCHRLSASALTLFRIVKDSVWFRP